MNTVRKIIEIDEDKCTGCGLCVVDCAEGALKIIDGKARVVNEIFCDGLGACIGACPEDALHIVEREAPAFDEAAVEEHLAKMAAPAAPKAPAHPAPHGHGGGCPGSMMRMFGADQGGEPAAGAQDDTPAPRSQLQQWPVQLRLLPYSGPLYQDKTLVLLADCVGAAYTDVQRKLIKDNAICMSCPKLDDPYEAIDKLAEIFKNPIRGVKVAVMEVPCCSGLVRIAQEAQSRAGTDHAIEVVTIGVRGDLLSR